MCEVDDLGGAERAAKWLRMVSRQQGWILVFEPEAVTSGHAPGNIEASGRAR